MSLRSDVEVIVNNSLHYILSFGVLKLIKILIYPFVFFKTGGNIAHALRMVQVFLKILCCELFKYTCS